MSITTYYKQTVTFRRYDGSLDSLGAPVHSTGNYDAIFSDKKCLLCPMSTDEKVKRDKKVSDRLYNIYCEDLAVREGDIAVIASTQYKVTDIKNPNSLSHHIRVGVEEII